MAFQTGTSSTLPNLIADLLTFATANGWTQDENDTVNGHVGFHRGSIYVQMRYNPAAATELSLYQSLGWINAATDPGSHTNDSGNGYNGPSAWSNANAVTERHVSDIGGGPYTYWFYEDDALGPYLHVVLNVSADLYRHMGFGRLVRSNDWTGGEYVYGQVKSVTLGQILQGDTCLLDGRFNATTSNLERLAATLHCESLPNQVASGKWGNVWANGYSGIPDDTAAVAKVNIQGGFRGGPLSKAMANLGAFGIQSGFVNLIPIECYYTEQTLARVHYLGYMPDVRYLNIRFFNPRQVVNVGGVNWHVFPTSHKVTTAGSHGTLYQGIAYAERA